MPFDPNQALGPLGALVLAVLAVLAFTRELVTPGSRTKRAEELALKAVEGWKAALDVNVSLVAALEARNKVDAERQRLERASLTKHAKGRE
jgi:hypothetical protein